MGDPASGAKSTNGSIEQGVIQPRTLPCLHACPPGRKSLQVTETGVHTYLLPTPFESQSPQPRLPLAPENPPGSARICMHARSHERRGPRKTTRLHSMHVIPASCMNQPFFFSLLPFFQITKVTFSQVRRAGNCTVQSEGASTRWRGEDLQRLSDPPMRVVFFVSVVSSLSCSWVASCQRGARFVYKGMEGGYWTGKCFILM